MAIIFKLAVLYLKNSLKNTKHCIISVLLIAAAVYYCYTIAPIAGRWPYLSEVIIPIALFLFTIFIRFFPALSIFHKPVPTYYPVTSFKRYCINLVADSFLNSYFVALILFIGMLQLNANTPLNFENSIPGLLFILMGLVIRRASLCVIYQRADSPGKKMSTLITFSLMLVASFLAGMHVTELKWVIMGVVILLIGSFLIEEKFTRLQRRSIIGYNFFNNTRLQMQFNNSKFLLHFVALIVVLACFLSVFSYALHKKTTTNTIQFVYMTCLLTSPLAAFTYILNNAFGFFDTYWLTCNKVSSSGRFLFIHYLRLAAVLIVAEVILMCVFLFINPEQVWMVTLLQVGTLPILIVLGFYWSVLFPKKIAASVLTLDTPTGIVPSILSIAICVSFITVQYSKWFALLGVLYLSLAILLVVKIDDFYGKNKHLLFLRLMRQ